MYHVQFQLQTVPLSSLDEWHGQKSFYHTSMFIQMAGKPHNCTSFKGHSLENGLKPVVCHHVNWIFRKILHDLSIRDKIQTTWWNNPRFHYRVLLSEAVWKKLRWHILQVLHNVGLSSMWFVPIMSVKEISQGRKCWQISDFHSSIIEMVSYKSCALYFSSQIRHFHPL
jgi:hypothetical protein